MQCAVCSMRLRVGRNKKLFCISMEVASSPLAGDSEITYKRHILWAFPAPKDPEPPTKRCCRDPYLQRRLRFAGDKEVINAIYFLFNFRAQSRSRIHLRCSEPAVLNCPPTRIYSHVWLIAGRQDQTKRARDNELASEETRGILSVSTKWTSVNEVEKMSAVTCSLTRGVKAWDNYNEMSGGMSYPVNSRKLAAGDSCMKIDAARD